jgi:peptidyl-tRNA hydrolase
MAAGPTQKDMKMSYGKRAATTCDLANVCCRKWLRKAANKKEHGCGTKQLQKKEWLRCSYKRAAEQKTLQVMRISKWLQEETAPKEAPKRPRKQNEKWQRWEHNK